MEPGVALQLVVTLELPSWAARDDLDQAVEAWVLPLAARLEAAAGVRLALHLGGHLLDGMARHHEAALLRLRAVAQRGQVEVLGGLFYGGPPALLPTRDVRCQVQMAGEFWESYLGAMPSGFWLPGGVWPEELPRLLEETGLTYGLVRAETIVGSAAGALPLCSLRRGAQSLRAVLVDGQLGASFGREPALTWLARVRRSAAAQGGTAVAQLDARQLLAEPGAAGGGPAPTWEALADGQVELVLPGAWAAGSVPAPLAAVRPPVAAPMSAADGALVARVLRASARLRAAVGVMEDEEMEERWSDGLATAQRLVFAAQAPDALTPGAEAAARQAAWRRLVEAERLIERTLAPAGDLAADMAVVRAERGDHDGDGCAETWLTSSRLGLWLEGGGPSLDPALWLRALEDRASGAELLGVTAAAPAGVWQGWAAAAGPPLAVAAWRPAQPTTGPGATAADETPPAAIDAQVVARGELAGAPGGTPRMAWRRAGLARLRPEVVLELEVEDGPAQQAWLRLAWPAGAPPPRANGAVVATGEVVHEVNELAWAAAPEVSVAIACAPPVSLRWRAAQGDVAGALELRGPASPTGALRLVWRLLAP